MADTVIVGKFVGNEALAAVGACGTLMFLIIGFLLGLTAGFTVITAQHYGAGNLQAMRQSVASGAILSAAVSLILTILSMAMMKDILRWMHTPADMYGQAYGYIMVICGGIAAQTLYNLAGQHPKGSWGQPAPFVFLDPGSAFKHRAGPFAHYQVPDGRSRSGICDRHIPGRIRAFVPALHYTEGS